MKSVKTFTLLLVLLMSLVASLKNAKRPFYVIGHMANDKELIKMFLESGSNSLEFDLQFTKTGEPTEFTHGYPCDLLKYCSRKTPFKQYLNYYAEDQYIKDTCHLAIFDLKIRSVETQYLRKAGGLFAEALNKYFYQNNNQIKSLFSLPTLSRMEFFQGFVDSPHSRRILDKVSFGVYVEPNVEESMKKLDQRFKNIPKFYGAGTSAWANWYEPKLHLIEKSCKFRDEGCKSNSILNKVWYWTAGKTTIRSLNKKKDNENLLRKLMRLEVDGICTNFPAIVRMVLDSEEFKKTYHLATKQDDPFKTFCKE